MIERTSSASSSGHLNVFTGLEESKLGAIMFPNRVENDGPSRHINAHGECLGGEEHLNQAHLEEQLDDLLHNGQNTAVMDTDSTR